MQDGTPPDKPSPLSAGGSLPGSTARLTQRSYPLYLNSIAWRQSSRMRQNKQGHRPCDTRCRIGWMWSRRGIIEP